MAKVGFVLVLNGFGVSLGVTLETFWAQFCYLGCEDGSRDWEPLFYGESACAETIVNTEVFIRCPLSRELEF